MKQAFEDAWTKFIDAQEESPDFEEVAREMFKAGALAAILEYSERLENAGASIAERIEKDIHDEVQA